MCGIVGIIDKKGIDRDILMEMCDSLIHRGPDDSGLWINLNKTIGLAHRRLAILDLSDAGRQPMSDCEGTIWLTFNGEIYNFQSIRAVLEKKGHTFKSNSDTEVVLNAYKEWGTDCIREFNGMFAFGIFDQEREIVFLARDRAGKKPLYYAISDTKFIFSSELKAILKDKAFSREIDLQALNSYLAFGYIGNDLCIFKAARKLPPAHAMIYSLRSGKSSIWKYWEPSVLSEQVHSEGELLEELGSLLQDSVRLRMISDVPIGAFLSGGVDSSLIVAMMSKVSNEPVKTFSIGFDESKYNELPYARIIARHFATDHHELIVKPDAFEVLPLLIKQFDEPFADSSLIPTYYVSKATREFVTVALSGDGGDELFGGYGSYLGTYWNNFITKILPFTLRKGLATLAGVFPDKFNGKRHLTRLRHDSYDAFIDRSTYRFFQEQDRRLLLNSNVIASLNDEFNEPETARRRYLTQTTLDLIGRLTYADFKTYLPDDILVKVDRTSMLVSLEVRAPLLDYRIAEFSFRNIPGSLKTNGLTTKYLLKKLARKILPKELEINRKKGFTIPVAEWFRGPLFNELREILLFSKNHFFKKNYIERLLQEHKSGIDHEGKLFTLLTFLLFENLS